MLYHLQPSIYSKPYPPASVTGNLKHPSFSGTSNNVNTSFFLSTAPQAPTEKKSTRFTFRDALFNFIKGAWAPIKLMLDKPFETIALLGGTGILLNVFPVLKPLLMSAGILISAAQVAFSITLLGKDTITGNRAKLGKDFQSLGTAASMLGTIGFGVKKSYGELSDVKGFARLFKTSWDLLREIVRTGRIPSNDTVFVLATSNPAKVKELTESIRKAEGRKGKSNIFNISNDPKKSHLSIDPLPEDERMLGSTYEMISKNKAGYHKAEDVFSATLQNQTGDQAALNGRTILSAFPGRRIVIVADDSGYNINIPLSKLAKFKAALMDKRYFGMSEKDVDAFIGGLNQPGERIEVLSTATHRNLDILSAHLPKNMTLPAGVTPKLAAERILAQIMQDIHVQAAFEFSSAVSSRDVITGLKSLLNRKLSTAGSIMAENQQVPVHDLQSIVSLNGNSSHTLESALSQYSPRRSSAQSLLVQWTRDNQAASINNMFETGVMANSTLALKPN